MGPWRQASYRTLPESSKSDDAATPRVRPPSSEGPGVKANAALALTLNILVLGLGALPLRTGTPTRSAERGMKRQSRRREGDSRSWG